MQVLVFGAGAIGSMLGHRLGQVGHAVTLVGRTDYVSAVRAQGLVLENSSSTSITHPAAVERLEDLPSDLDVWDLVLLTVKAHDTQLATQTLAGYVDPGVPILLMQNGVGGEELVQAVWPAATLISGVITWPVSVLAPGRVRLRSTRGGASLAPTCQGQNIARWVELFNAAGVRTVICPDYRSQKWSKLLLNMLANAVPAILDMAPGEVFDDPQLFELERLAFLEALAVMHALGLRVVSFPEYPVPMLTWAVSNSPPLLSRPLLRRLVAGGRGEKKPSLQIDLELGRQRSEVTFLNGAVVAHAKPLGLDVPVNRVLSGTLSAIVSGQVPWDEFRKRPHKLVAAVQAARGG